MRISPVTRAGRAGERPAVSRGQTVLAAGRMGPVMTSDRGRRCLLAAAGLSGAALLRMSLSAETDSRRFYALTAGLAGTWTAGALLTTAVPVRSDGRRPLAVEVTASAVTGAATFALLYAAARVARSNPFLRRAIASVLRYADQGTTPAVLLTASVNAVAEELFFRGALWDASGADPLASTTLVYTVFTAATGNPALIIGGVITSVIFGQQRAWSGGVAAPAIAHLTWSALMLTYLPPMFRPSTASGPRLVSLLLVYCHQISVWPAVARRQAGCTRRRAGRGTVLPRAGRRRARTCRCGSALLSLSEDIDAGQIAYGRWL